MDTALHNKAIEYKLENILVIDFFNAINENSPKLICENMTDIDLNNLLIDYQYEFKDDDGDDYIWLIVEGIESKIFSVISLINIIDIFWGDLDIVKKKVEQLKKLGYNIELSTIDSDMRAIMKDVELLSKKAKKIKSSLGSKNNNDKKSKINIYKILAGISASLKFEIDYSKLTIIKYIYYVKTLKDINNESR